MLTSILYGTGAAMGFVVILTIYSAIKSLFSEVTPNENLDALVLRNTMTIETNRQLRSISESLQTIAERIPAFSYPSPLDKTVDGLMTQGYNDRDED